MKAIRKKKILALLGAGLALMVVRSPKQYFKIIKSTHKYFKLLNKGELFRLVKEFKNERLIKYKDHTDGNTTIVLTEIGKKKTLHYNLDELYINKPMRWDKKWRLVMFDIPEKKKNAREVFRRKLNELGFYQLQKSTFIHPYECEDEINFVIEMFELRPYVRIAEVIKISNEATIKLNFGIH